MRGRFAPSPTGLLHLGNARTALLAWLQVRAAGGQFVLRMEDLDTQRSRPLLATQILDDLRWLGLDWDEGPDVGGPYGSYTQSERRAEYDAALAKLSAAGLLYPCYCSRAELQRIAGAPHGPQDDGPPYPGRCRTLTPAEQAERADARPTPALRFAVPTGEICFADAVAGPVCQDVADRVGDFVVRRADGLFAYQLAVVVDDAAMGITHVLRGDDLLYSAPRQIALQRALDLPTPAYAHVPLLVGPDGNRLAKRHGDTSLAGLRARGIGGPEVVGWLAYWCGLLPAPEPTTPAELVAAFDLSKLPRTPVTVDQLPPE